MNDYRARNIETEQTSRESVSGLKFYTSVATAALATAVGALTGGCDRPEEHYQLPVDNETGTKLVEQMESEQSKRLERNPEQQKQEQLADKLDLNLEVDWLSKYMYRGIPYSEGPVTQVTPSLSYNTGQGTLSLIGFVNHDNRID